MKKILLIALVFTLVLSMTACGKKEVKEAEQVNYVKTEVPSTRDFSDKLVLPATLKAKNEASVNANSSAMVKTVNVRVGDRVVKGQVLASLDGDLAAKAFQKAKVNYLNSDKTYGRVKYLFQEGAISQSDYDSAKLLYDVALEDYNLAKLNMSYSNITAPMSGVISERNIEVGQTAAPGQPAFSIVDLSNLIAESGVSEAYISKLQYGQSANVILPSGERYEGKIDTISPVVTPDAGSYPVSVSISNQNGNLKADMFVSIEIIFGTNKGSMALSNTSIINEDGQYFVFVDNKGKAEKRKIKTGIKDEKYTEILEGINVKERVISVGYDTLKDGDKVKVIKEQ